MAFYAVDIRDKVVRKVTEQYDVVDKKRFFLVEAASAQQARAKACRLWEAIGTANCGCCRHGRCPACEECSVTKRYSDYWICHCCGELNRRLQNRIL
jgi:hypothetical protein